MLGLQEFCSPHSDVLDFSVPDAVPNARHRGGKRARSRLDQGWAL
jgi:hypothetical protein